VEQIAFCNTLKSIEKTLQKHFEQNKEHLSEKAEQLVQTKKYVKEIKTYPKKPVEKGNRKVDDTTKPPRMYLPLMITKNGKCLTNIYNEHDEVFDFHSILDVRGVIKPIIKFDYVYKCKHKTRIVKLIYKSGSSTPDCLSARGSEQVCVENNDKQTYDREESSTEPTLPLGFEQVKPSLEMVDGLLINMV